MAEELNETVYVGHDNAIVLRLTEDGAPADLADVTRMMVDLGPVEVDSAVSPALVAWAGDTVTLKLGTAPALGGLGKSATARLIVYTPENPNGIVWIERIRLRIVPQA